MASALPNASLIARRLPWVIITPFGRPVVPLFNRKGERVIVKIKTVDYAKLFTDIRECIDDKDKTKQIPDAISQGFTTYGMQTFDQSLMSINYARAAAADFAKRRDLFAMPAVRWLAAALVLGGLQAIT